MFQQAGIHPETSIAVASFSGEDIRKSTRDWVEERKPCRCMRVRLSQREVRRILRRKGSLRSATLGSFFFFSFFGIFRSIAALKEKRVAGMHVRSEYFLRKSASAPVLPVEER